MIKSSVYHLFETVKNIYLNKESGILTLFFDSGKRFIYFINGEIRYARSQVKDEKLGFCLIENDIINENELDPALDESKIKGMKLGELLISKGVCDEEAVSFAVLSVVKKIILRPFFEAFTKLEFTKGEVKLDEKITFNIATGDILIEVVRLVDNDNLFSDFYVAIKDMAPQICKKTHVIYENLNLCPEEGFVFSRVDGSFSVYQIEQICGINNLRLSKIMFALTLLGMIEFPSLNEDEKTQATANKPSHIEEDDTGFQTVDKKEPLFVKKEESPPAKETSRSKKAEMNSTAQSKQTREEKKFTPLSDEDMEFVDEVKKRLRALEKNSYYDMLGVPYDAPTKKIKDVYLRLVKKFHPDKYAHKRFGNLGNRLDTLFAELTRAYDILSSESKRKHYDLKILKEYKLRDLTYFRKRKHTILEEALMTASQGEIEKGIDIAEMVLKYNKQDAEAYMILGKIQIQNPSLTEKAMDSFNRAITLNPELYECYLLMARNYRKHDMIDKAINCYKSYLMFEDDNKEALNYIEEQMHKAQNNGIVGKVKGWFS